MDQRPPISANDAALERCRALALRATIEVMSDAVIGAAVAPLFLKRADERGDPHAILTRLLRLLRRLVEHELPNLRRSVLCETARRATWQRAPAGGRVDAAASVRASMAREGRGDPSQWLVVRAERLADTPVNRLVASILRATEGKLRRVATLDDAAGSLLRRERSLVTASIAAIHSFFATSPLGDLPAAGDPSEADLLAVLRRRAELARFGSLLAWWRELAETELASLKMADSTSALHELSPGACYEIVCALALVLALRDRFPAEPPDAAGIFTFRAPEGPVRVTLGARAIGRFGKRSCTALLSLPTGARVIVEARNARPDAAHEIANFLYEACARPGSDTAAYLLTPSPGLTAMDAPDEPDVAFQWCSFLAGLDEGAASPVDEWGRLLDDIFSSMRKGQIKGQTNARSL